MKQITKLRPKQRKRSLPANVAECMAIITGEKVDPFSPPPKDKILYKLFREANKRAD